MVKTVAGITAVGVPRILPSRAASLAGLQPKVNPSGNSPTISHEDTSPKPVRFGSRIEISSSNVRVSVLVGVYEGEGQIEVRVKAVTNSVGVFIARNTV